MIIHFEFGGYGFLLTVLRYDILQDNLTILAWSIMRRHILWRGESHSRSVYGYVFSRYKNGERVENIKFQSPIVSSR